MGMFAVVMQVNYVDGCFEIPNTLMGFTCVNTEIMLYCYLCKHLNSLLKFTNKTEQTRVSRIPA